MMKYILLLTVLLTSFKCHSFKTNEYLLNSFDVKNNYNEKFQKNGFWIENSDNIVFLGFYNNGKKEGVWMQIKTNILPTGEVSIFEKIIHYEDNNPKFEMKNENDSLYFFFDKDEELGIKYMEKLFIKKEKYLRSDYLESIKDKEIRIGFEETPSFSWYNNSLTIDFPYANTSVVYIMFSSIYPDEPQGINKDNLLIKSIKKTQNKLFSGKHYLFNYIHGTVYHLNYQEGWLHGDSRLFNTDTSTVIAKFEKGKLLKVFKLERTSIFKTEASKKYRVNRRNIFKLLSKENYFLGHITDYLGVHFNCSSCILNMFHGFYGLDFNSMSKSSQRKKMSLVLGYFKEYEKLGIEGYW